MSALRQMGRLFVVAPLIWGVVPRVAAAQAPADGDGLMTAEQVLSSEFDFGDHLAIRLTVTADRLIDGHIEASNGDGGLIIRQEVEVAGGSTEEYLVLMPTSSFNQPRLRIELFDGDKVLDRDDLSYTHDSGTDVAGVLPVLLARSGEPPARVTLPGDVRRVNMVSLPVDVLGMGAAALSQLDSIAATSDDLTALTSFSLAALLTWIDEGGHLVLDDSDDLSALPQQWVPGVEGYALAGQGEIRVADGVLSSGRWKDAFVPAGLAAADSPTGFVGTDMVIDPRITLAQRSGVKLPDLTKIIAVLGGYVVLIGPILYLVLRRARRLTAAWLVIPALALVLAGGVVVTGSSWRTGGRPTSSTVIEVHPGGGYATVEALVYRRSGGTSSVSMPAGWEAGERSGFGWFGEDTSGGDRSFVYGDDGPRMEARLEPGQIAVLNLEGPDPAELLAIEGHMVTGSTVTGTVTNTGAVTLRAVAVFAGGRATLIGDLAAGTSKGYTIADLLVTPDPFTSALGTVWPAPQFGLGFESEVEGVDLGIWTSFAARVGSDLYPVGQVRVAGWSDEMPAAVGSPGAFANTTLVTGLSPIRVSSGALPASAVRWSWVQAPFDPQTGAPGEPVVRFVVPPGSALDELQLQLPSGISDVEVLDADGEWLKLKPGRNDQIDVPAHAVRHGALLVRSTLDFSQPVDVSTVVPVLIGGSP